MRNLFLVLMLFVLKPIFAQQEIATDTIASDSLYREDQFYFNFTYNNLYKKPALLTQNQFSAGLSGGFLRDMPINKDRTLAIAAGIGYSYSGYNTNLLLTQTSTGQIDYQITPQSTNYSKNKLVLHHIEIPLEFRWRNSTANNHRFWRIYTGFKISYLLNSKYTFTSTTSEVTIKNNTDLNKISYGATLAAGWNTWNIYVYYGFNTLFKNKQIGTENLDIKTLNIGLQFYIL
jgi:hypothetical protein